MRGLIIKFLAVLVGISGCFINNAEAGGLSPEDFDLMYKYAANGNLYVLNSAKSRGLDIDALNEDGDSGLCVAARKRNVVAYRTFVQAGANPRLYCTLTVDGYHDFAQSVDIYPTAANQDEARLSDGKNQKWSTTKKVLVGSGAVAVIGGVTALALSGGGGSKKSDPVCSGHGLKNDSGECECVTGYTGSNCAECASGYVSYEEACYQNLNCSNQTHSTGTQIGNQCECQTGYAGTLCTECANNYGKNSSGQCVAYDNDKIKGLAIAKEAGTYSGDININYNPLTEIAISNTGSSEGSKYTTIYGLIYQDATQTSGDYSEDIGYANMANNYVKMETKSITIDDPDSEEEGATKDINVIAYYDANGKQLISYDAQGNPQKRVVTVDDGSTEGLSVSDVISYRKIGITNNSDSYVYGVYSSTAENIYNTYADESNIGSLEDSGNIISSITINNTLDGQVYGIYGNGNVYSSYGSASDSSEVLNVNSYITINNNGSGSAYGLYTSGFLSESDEDINSDIINGIWLASNNTSAYTNTQNGMTLNSKIIVKNTGSGNAYGLYAQQGAIYNGGESITVSANSGNAYGLYSIGGIISNQINTDVEQTTLNVSSASGNAYGLYMENYESDNNSATGLTGTSDFGTGSAAQTTNQTITNGRWISISSTNGDAYGIYGENATITNHSQINAVTENGNAFGIFNKGGTVTNDNTSSDSEVYAKGTGFVAGIYSEGGTVTNTGVITVDGPAETTYGIYATKGATVVNKGDFIITVNGVKIDKDSSDCKGTISKSCILEQGGVNHNMIYISDDSVFVNEGKVSSSTSLSLAKTVLSSGGSFSAQEISGDLTVSSDTVTNGFKQTYTLTDAIIANDTSNLALNSGSSLYEASLSGSDVNLTMKSFSDVVDNKSLADFLQKNYALQNNENFYNTLKSQETVAGLNDTLNDLTGKKMFSRFADEDLTMMRELTFDINNKLFNNNENHLETAGSISTFNFNGNTGSDSRYALISQDYGKYNLGLNYGFANVSSDDGHDNNRRYEKMFHVGTPVSYGQSGFKFITTPHVGYASGSYDREGLNNEDYDGNIQKTMFGLMNEARYPVALGNWTIAPSAEFNMVDYRTQGHEKGSTNKLRLASQNNYSVEAGVGIYANTEHKFGEKSKLTFVNGVAMYHEFADPYRMNVGIDGMSGNFRLKDENRTYNRAVVRTGLTFANDNMSISGNVMSYIDKQYRTNATLDYKYAF